MVFIKRQSVKTTDKNATTEKKPHHIEQQQVSTRIVLRSFSFHGFLFFYMKYIYI